jgi:hypothetical protein
MRHLKYVIPVLVVLLVVVGGWLFWKEQGHNLLNSIDDNGLPSQSQRAAVLALIPQKGANLYSLPNNQVQNLTNLPRVNGNAIGSMIVHLQPIALAKPLALPGTNTIAPISTSTSLASASALVLNFPPRLTSNYQPTLVDVERAGSCDVNPLDLTSRMQPKDQNLIDWLQEREWDLANDQNSDQEAALEAGADNNLSYIMSSTKLSWFQLYELGSAFYNNTNDYKTAAIFYIETIKRAHQVLERYVFDAPETKPILLAMHKTKTVLWNTIDENRDPWCIKAEFILNNDLIHWIKPDGGDPLFENIYVHGEIGLIGCNYIQGNFKQAIIEAQNIDLRGLNQDQKASVAWDYSLPLFASHRYADAACQLAVCADDSSFNRCADAWPYLIEALCQSGQIKQAQSRYQEYLTQFKPSNSQIVELKYFLLQIGREN